ncbi:GTP binding protein 6 (putative) (predicted), isoform CRA_a [Rattus norvegicus]|uniref:GTP binding protein 6 (Putative) (Predicted), isoform CRA_a n=2 Tax=Rattus norvegicus TaxID=10116 RepID=A6J2D6_RAT|nr:GTP binding protein 6 (putative) (predicted), isoform CRA_a [Rattus norvegicus]
MLFPRVAALPGIWLLRVRRVQHALSLAGTLPRPVRAVSAGSRALGSVWASDGPVRGGGPEDPREDEEEEELLRVPPLLPFDAQRVCVLHPDVKRPAGKTPRSTEKIRGCQDITSVFLNVERMTPQTQKELETAWGLRVFDRFTLVLHIFRCNARTREARMQLALAEIPLLRSSVSGDSEQQDQQGWGSRYIMGSGESFSELRARALRDRELRLRRVLERLRDKRRLMRKERVRREFPVVSVVGYTNCGKTTLIRALTGEATLQPRDQPFATLDVTVHEGRLPSRLRVLYVDTIGFLSQLPHSLIHAFSATLEDVAYSDVLVHVTDVSHPDAELQKATVLSTLRGLGLRPALLESAVEVHSKVDLVPGHTTPCSGALAVSAVSGRGLDELKAALEASVLRATGRQLLTIRVRLGGPQLGWLYNEAVVQQVQELPEGGAAHVTVVITQAAYGRFQKLFPTDITSDPHTD